jgi:hypothetical protein
MTTHFIPAHRLPTPPFSINIFKDHRIVKPRAAIRSAPTRGRTGTPFRAADFKSRLIRPPWGVVLVIPTLPFFMGCHGVPKTAHVLPTGCPRNWNV